MNRIEEKTTLLLFTIESHVDHGGSLAIFPGVPRELFKYPDVRALRQGSEVQICLLSGVHRSVPISDYFVSVSESPTDEEMASAPIVLVVNLTVEEAPIGTHVRLPLT